MIEAWHHVNPPAEPDLSAEEAPEPDSVPEPGPVRPNRFFSWMRELGIPRQPGWIGGVAAGIAQRLGVDPIIVRGIIVVVAVLGGPAVLLYAAAWLLLPDREARIHAEQLGRGRFDPALVGIGIMALLSFLPLNQGFWWAGAAFWGDLSLGASVGRALWTGVLLSGIVVFIIVIARRGKSSTTTVPATTDDKPDTIPTPVPPARQGAEPTTVSPPDEDLAPPEAPPAPGADADADELQEWKERQTLWKQQHAEWKAQQTATERELRQQRALEAHERGLAASAARVERRRLRKVANPRINAATAWAALGLSIIAGGIAALASSDNPDVCGHEATIALAVSAITLGLATIVAGVFRRRSGVLSFFALVAVLAMLVSAAFPRDRQLLMWGVGWGVGVDSRIAVPVGPLHLAVHDSAATGVTDVWQGRGDTDVWVARGASVKLQLVSSSGNITVFDEDGRSVGIGEGVNGVQRVGDDYRWTVILGPELEPDRTVRLEQDGGRLIIYDDNVIRTPDVPNESESSNETELPDEPELPAEGVQP